MPLVETRNAIGVAHPAACHQIASRTDATTVDIGRPEASARAAGPKLNIFLYGFEHDAFMRNTPLDRGQRAADLAVPEIPDDRHRQRPRQRFLRRAGAPRPGHAGAARHRHAEPARAGAADNPEPIKISFDNPRRSGCSPPIMQGTDEHYRLSAAFEVRPILLAEVAGAGGAPLILSVGAPAQPGVLVLPSLGPRLDAGGAGEFRGRRHHRLAGGDLAADQVEVCFGQTCFAVPPADVTNRLRAH